MKLPGWASNTQDEQWDNGFSEPSLVKNTACAYPVAYADDDGFQLGG